MANSELSAAAAAMGRKGGKKRAEQTDMKKLGARSSGNRTRGEDRKGGWPKGKPRKVKQP